VGISNDASGDKFGLRAGYQVEYKQFGAEIAGFNIGLCFALITW
jgi:hypothetical protein